MQSPLQPPRKTFRIVPRSPKIPHRPAGLPVREPQTDSSASTPFDKTTPAASAPPATTQPPLSPELSHAKPEVSEDSLPPASVTATLPDDAPTASSLYRALLRGLYDAILIVNPDGRIVDCNRRARMFFQYDYTELCAIPIDSLVSGMSPILLQRIQNNLDTGRFTLLDGFCVRRDSTRFPVEIAISQLVVENRVDLVFSVRNVTRRRAMEAQLRTEHNALQNSASGVVITDRQAIIQYANPAFSRLLGLDPERVNEKVVTTFWRTVERTTDDLTTTLIEGPLGGQDWSGEIEGTHTNGRDVRVQATASANRDPAGKPIGLVYSFVDITERHIAQQRIRREADAQMQAAQHQDAFAGRLNIISLNDILQLILTTGKTGALTISDDADQPMGEAVFDAGNLIAASHGDRTGEDALMALLTQPGTAFQFDPEKSAPKDLTIVKPLMTLLMEAAQSIDESSPS